MRDLCSVSSIALACVVAAGRGDDYCPQPDPGDHVYNVYSAYMDRAVHSLINAVRWVGNMSLWWLAPSAGCLKSRVIVQSFPGAPPARA